MELQEIDVYINKSGEVRIEVRGMKGNGCRDATKALEAALGGEVISREATAEALEAGEGVNTQTWQTLG